MTVCAVLFDGPVLEQALPGDGSLGPLMALGVDEIILFQKVHEIIRANPGKAEGLFEKFRQILKEENKEELICNQCPGFNNRDEWDATQMRSSLLPPLSHDSIKKLQKRDIRLRRKVAKKEKKFAEKKDRQNMKPRKVERKQNGVENSKKRKKFGKNKNQKEKKKSRKSKEASQKKKRKRNKKIKKIVKMKKIKQSKLLHGNKRTTNLEKLEELCVNVWAELTRVGLGAATTLKKQVGDIDLVQI